MSTTTGKMLQKLALSGKDLPTPLYILNQQILEENIDALYRAFNKRFRRFIFGYSCKTNYASDILRTVCRKSGYLEVVSPMELQHAKRFVPCSRIIYNGVIPDLENKLELARMGGIVNLENLTELQAMDDLASERDLLLDVGIRLNLSLTGAAPSRFGIELTPESLSVIDHLQSLRIAGVHCHITKSRSLDCWREKAGLMADAAKKLRASHIDLGGNMYGPMNPELQKQFSCSIPSFAEYADCIHEEFSRYFSEDDMPALIIEAGTPIVSDAQSYLTSVVDIKTIGGRTICTLDGKKLDITVIGDSGKQFPFYVVSQGIGKVENASMYGCTCLEFDRLADSYTGPLSVGDLVLFDNIGSYSNVLAPPFIQAAPGMVCYDKERFIIIKFPDDQESVFGRYLQYH